MRDFFRSWRRNVGVVTLLMACGFAVAWVRSRHVFDIVQFPIMLSFSNGIGTATMFSSDCGIVWSSSSTSLGGRQRMIPYWSAFSSSHGSYGQIVWDLNNSLNGPETTWKLKGCGIGYGEVVGIFPRCSLLLIPYWSIVLPLTLLSAFFLLSQPRLSNSKKPPESIAPKLN